MVRRLVALLLMLLLVAETAGAAQAFGIDATVHCCCGSHSAARHCRCGNCPVLSRSKKSHGARLVAGGGCHPHGDQDGRLVPLAIGGSLPSLASPAFAGLIDFPLRAPLEGRAADDSRPPP